MRYESSFAGQSINHPDPTLAAVSTCLIVLAILMLFPGDRLVGLRRMASIQAGYSAT